MGHHHTGLKGTAFPSPAQVFPLKASVWKQCPVLGTNGFKKTLTKSLLQFSSVAGSCPTLCDPMDCSTPGLLSITNAQSLLKLESIKSVMPSNHLALCGSLFPLPSIFPSIRVFSNEWALCIRWPKYWSFSFSISPSKEYSGLISFRMDWLDLLAVQGTLKSLLQHHSSKHQFFSPQLSL